MALMDDLSEVITKPVIEFKEVFDSLCTHCGECCRGQAIFLTDVEAPFIARRLKELGGNSLVENHLSINSTVFDKWHRYVLQFEKNCPFLDGERCSIYHERPLTCQLYPMSIIGFIDRPKSDVKDVYLEIMKPLDNHTCLQSYDDLVGICDRSFGRNKEHANQILRFLASTMVDERGVGYLFGQEPKRGKEAIMLDSSNPSAEEVEMAISIYYEKRFRNQHSENVLDYPDAISNEEIDRLTSDTSCMKSNETTSKRIARIKNCRPYLMAFYTESMQGL